MSVVNFSELSIRMTKKVYDSVLSDRKVYEELEEFVYQWRCDYDCFGVGCGVEEDAHNQVVVSVDEATGMVILRGIDTEVRAKVDSKNVDVVTTRRINTEVKTKVRRPKSKKSKEVCKNSKCGMFEEQCPHGMNCHLGKDCRWKHDGLKLVRNCKEKWKYRLADLDVFEKAHIAEFGDSDEWMQKRFSKVAMKASKLYNSKKIVG